MAKDIDNLTRDVLAAQAAGVTYGKYKGLQHERQPMVAVPAPPDPKTAKLRYLVTCIVCGKVFNAARKNRKICSEHCYAIHDAAKAKKKREAARNGGQ